MRLRKGSPEAKAWGKRMRGFRKTRNPGASWHKRKQVEAKQSRTHSYGTSMKSFYAGKVAAHAESELEAKTLGMNPHRRPLVESAARELLLFAQNDGMLYKLRGEPIILNLVKKWNKGAYDPKKAVDLWMYWATDAAKRYDRSGDGLKIFSPATRYAVAEMQESHIREEFSLGNYGAIKKNPISVLGLGNPNPGHSMRLKRGRTHLFKHAKLVALNAKVEGVIYNRVIEIKAQKTSWEKGYYRHPFGRKSKAQILALDNGDLLIHSTNGTPLWDRA